VTTDCKACLAQQANQVKMAIVVNEGLMVHAVLGGSPRLGLLLV